MKRRPVEYAGGKVEFLLDDEEAILPSGRNELIPLRRVSADAALRQMAGIDGAGVLSQRLGETGPLVASRAGVENAANADANLFAAKFGRDSMIIAAFLPYTRLRRATLEYWAARQGTKVDSRTHEQPGAFMHEERSADDPQRERLEAAGHFFPDFGSTDAPLLWALAYLNELQDDLSYADKAVTHYETGEQTSLRTVFTRTLALLDEWQKPTEANPEGLIESHAIAGIYSSFPYWKDSPDAYHHKDGSLATEPVSSVELMAYLYDAYAMAGLQDRADEVRAKLIEHYWVEDGQFFALGTDRGPDGALRKLEVKSSNMGYLLDSGILEGDDMAPYRDAVINHLMSDVMLCPAGIRTLASDELRFGPNTYHNGSVWPHDTYKIARGMRRQGRPELAEVLMGCIERSCEEFMPELVPGTDDLEVKPNMDTLRVTTRNVRGREITHSRVKSPQPLQGWTAAALMAVKLTMHLVRDEAKTVLRSGHVGTSRTEMYRDVVKRAPLFARNHQRGLELHLSTDNGSNRGNPI